MRPRGRRTAPPARASRGTRRRRRHPPRSRFRARARRTATLSRWLRRRPREDPNAAALASRSTMDPVWLARLQFSLTIMFHFLFPPISIGLSALLFVLETARWRTNRDVYRRASDFW